MSAPDRIWADHLGLAVVTDMPRFRSDIEYIRADLVPQWQPIETAPKDGTEFQVLAYNKTFKDYFWVPCAKFETPQSRVPSAYLYESQSWDKFKTGMAAYWMPSVSPTPPPAT